MIKNEQYYNPSRDIVVLFKAFKGVIKDLGFHPIKMIIAIIIESYCRISGMLYVKSGKMDKNVWDQIESTKEVEKLPIEQNK